MVRLFFFFHFVPSSGTQTGAALIGTLGGHVVSTRVPGHTDVLLGMGEIQHTSVTALSSPPLPDSISSPVEVSHLALALHRHPDCLAGS